MSVDHRLSLAEEIALAAKAVSHVLDGHALPEKVDGLSPGRQSVPPRSKAAVRDMAYRAVRELGRCEALLFRLNKKLPQVPVKALQIVALEQLIAPIRDDHTVVNQAVQAARLNPETERAGGLVNAILRRFLREKDDLLAKVDGDLSAHWNFPHWWIETLKREQPQSWQQTLAVSGQAAPMTLRVNNRKTTRSDYMALLGEQSMAARVVGPDAIVLERACDVGELPGFADGLVSVQDAGAQLAAELLDVRSGMRVLDACAAPGGKTAHLLECNDLNMVALDLDGTRLTRVADNLKRLDLGDSAELKVGDAGDPDKWFDGQQFDRILLDAPCTASGIVRRHPEIRWLRRRRDIETLASQQSQILAGLWSTLKPGGKLLYATCSVFNAEGEGVIKRFLGANKTARRVAINGRLGGASVAQPIDQLLPHATSSRDHDGFFYALIEKLE